MTSHTINLYDLFKVKENQLFTIITTDNECKTCKINNGKLLEDVGYIKDRFYNESCIEINNIAMVQRQTIK